MEKSAYHLTWLFEEDHWWYRARREIINAIISLHVFTGFDPKRLILDFGCGTGRMLRLLRRFGRSVGAEHSKEVISFKKDNCFCLVREFELPFRHAAFDLIVLLDVLEHIDNDRKALTSLAKWMKPGGFLVVFSPAFPWLWSGEDRLSHHVRRYTRHSLRETVEGSGLSILRISYTNFFLFPLIVAAIVLKRIFEGKDSMKSSMKSSVSQLPRPLNSLLYHVWAAERYLFPKILFPVGASVFLVARKSLLEADA